MIIFNINIGIKVKNTVKKKEIEKTHTSYIYILIHTFANSKNHFVYLFQFQMP